MSWQWSPSVIAELVAAAILLVLAIYFPPRDLNRQARLTGVTPTFGCALWMLSHALEIALPVISYKEPLGWGTTCPGNHISHVLVVLHSALPRPQGSAYLAFLQSIWHRAAHSRTGTLDQ
jgi:hypothetical protein